MKYLFIAFFITSIVTSFADQPKADPKDPKGPFLGITDGYFPGLVGGSFGGVSYRGIQREMTECHKDPNEPNVIHCPDGDYTKSAGISTIERSGRKEIPTGNFGVGSFSTAGAVGQ